MAIFSKQITERAILQVLTAGFALVILLLIAIGFVGVQSLDSIRGNTTELVAEQLVLARLVDEIQREQGTLSAIFYNLDQVADPKDRERLQAQLDEADRHVVEAVQEAAGTPEEPLWLELRKATQAFSREARRLLRMGDLTAASTSDLFNRHEDVVAVVAKLTTASYQNARVTQEQINDRAAELSSKSIILLGACVVVALLSTALTVRMATALFRRMEWQTSELSRVSWQMLENQETTARRFSHELHDELGQSLSAVKANLVAIETAGFDRQRLFDCLELVDESIGNVRELAQLLHPSILDDFGLDAALRWLCEGFRQRTRIETEYHSEFTGRLPDDTEIHLFRLAQEALTNVARHSGATQVSVRLAFDGAEVALSIADNGRGIPDSDGGSETKQGLGMIGMRARARSAGGELKIFGAPGKGLRVEARVPARLVSDEQEDPHPAGR